MAGGLSTPTAAILALWLAGPLYGINTVLAASCLVILSTCRLKSHNRLLAILIFVQFLFCTGHLISILVQLIKGFVHTPSVQPASGTASNQTAAIDAYFNDQGSIEHVVETALYAYNVRYPNIWSLVFSSTHKSERYYGCVYDLACICCL